MPQPPTGRPRLYCSGRCRVRAQRRRLAAAAALDSAQWQPVAAGVPDITAADLACLETSDPDEAVMQSVMRALQAKSALGLAATIARPQLSWRCERVANHLAADLRRYFKVDC